MKKINIGLDFSKLRNPSQGTLGRSTTLRFPTLPPSVERSLPLPNSNYSKNNSISHLHSSSPQKIPHHAAPNDKTVCQYCGVSYLTIAEMRTLQATVREQGEKLQHFKEVMAENTNLKDALLKNQRRYDDETNRLKSRCSALVNQLQIVKEKESSSSQAALTVRPNKSMSSSEIMGREEERRILQDKVRSLELGLKQMLTSQSGDSPGGDKEEVDVDTEKLLSKLDEINRIISSTYPSPSGDTKKQLGSSLEISDLRRENQELCEKLRVLTSDYSNCQEMHSALRNTLDKLKMHNGTLHEETNSLRVQFEDSVVRNENLEAQLKGIQTEHERLISSTKELELRLRATEEQNKALRSTVDQRLVEKLQSNLNGVKKQIQEQKLNTEKIRQEFASQLAEAQRETSMEKERADSCLAESLRERENVEKRWEERWSRHQTSLTEQLENLRASYETTLASVKGHEEGLQKEVVSLKEKYEKSKEAWEAYRKSLADQIAQWKAKYEQKHGELELARQSKVEVELLYQEKSAEMENLHEIIHEGCEERQELQKKLGEMQERFEEVRLQSQSYSHQNQNYNRSIHSVPPLQLNTNNNNRDNLNSNHQHKLDPPLAPSPTQNYSESIAHPISAPPTTVPQQSGKQMIGGMRKLSSGSLQPPGMHLFTIGKGLKQSVSGPSSPSGSIKSSVTQSKSKSTKFPNFMSAKGKRS